MEKNLGVIVQHYREKQIPCGRLALRESEKHKTRVSNYQKILWRVEDEGMAGFESGQSRDSCPYRKRHDLRKVWLGAWNKCAKKFKGEGI